MFCTLLKSYSFRQYLADNVVPFLTEGLIELCKSHPEDPVDTLVKSKNKQKQLNPEILKIIMILFI